jgi:hypothetical protein
LHITDKGEPGRSQGRKATGPRFLCEATDDSPKDPGIAGLQTIQQQREYVMRIFNALLSNSVLRIFLVPQALTAPPGGHLNITEVWLQTLVNSLAFQRLGY